MKEFIKFFSMEMERPHSYGWYHFLWIGIVILSIVIIFKRRNKYSEKELNKVLLFYGITAFLLELIKQIIWSYDLNTGVWDYQWYAAPYQLCTTPIYASIMAAFIKNKNVKNSLLSYIAYITFLGSLVTIIYPESCFVRTIEVNIHTMFLHCGSFILSIYIMVNCLKNEYKNLFSSYKCFFIFETIALLLDIIIYNSGILNGETFNMFFISPYFISTLPVFDYLQTHLPYIVFLLIYNLLILLGGFIVYKLFVFLLKKYKNS